MAGIRCVASYLADVILNSVSNVCEAVPKSLFWVPNRLNKLPEVRFEFPFTLIGKSTMAFLTGQSWRVLKSCYTGGDPVPYVAQASAALRGHDAYLFPSPEPNLVSL